MTARRRGWGCGLWARGGGGGGGGKQTRTTQRARAVPRAFVASRRMVFSMCTSHFIFGSFDLVERSCTAARSTNVSGAPARATREMKERMRAERPDCSSAAGVRAERAGGAQNSLSSFLPRSLVIAFEATRFCARSLRSATMPLPDFSFFAPLPFEACGSLELALKLELMFMLKPAAGCIDACFCSAATHSRHAAAVSAWKSMDLPSTTIAKAQEPAGGGAIVLSASVTYPTGDVRLVSDLYHDSVPASITQ